jgi:hypothetical protein
MMQKFDVERFKLKNIKKADGKEQHQVKISLENLNDTVDIN